MKESKKLHEKNITEKAVVRIVRFFELYILYKYEIITDDSKFIKYS